MDELDRLPRLGLVAEASPVSGLPALAEALGLSWLGAKRDDLLPALHGGAKVRKLDHLLATAPWAGDGPLLTMGAIGSGHLVACAAAARHLGRPLRAHLFWEPVEGVVEENLAFTASWADALRFHPSRLHLGLRAPGLLLRPRHAGATVIGPGGTHPPAVVGVLRGVAELARQVAEGALPWPDRIVVALGSGGTAAGLWLGAALFLRRGGRVPTVQAGAAVERIFMDERRLRVIARRTVDWLRAQGIGLPSCEPGPLEVVHRAAGPAYGHASPASRAASARLHAHGLAVEPIYTGKAFAPVLERPPRGEAVLLWHTPRAAGPLPTREDWKERLPAALRARLSPHPGRRRLVLAGAGLLAVGLLGPRGLLYPALPGPGPGRLGPALLLAAAEVILPRLSPEARARVGPNVERFLRSMPPAMRAEVAALFVAVEQGTPLGGHLPRFSSLPVERREALLQRLARGPAPLRLLYRGLRDLCLLGAWQQPALWAGIGYDGPQVPEAPRVDAYTAMFSSDPPRGWQGPG